MNEKEPPGGSGKLWVGDRSLCVALLLAFCFTWTVLPFNGNSRPNTRIKTVKTFPLGGFTPLLHGVVAPSLVPPEESSVRLSAVAASANLISLEATCSTP